MLFSVGTTSSDCFLVTAEFIFVSIIALYLGPHPALRYIEVGEGYRNASEDGNMGTRLSHLNLATICARHATLILTTII